MIGGRWYKWKGYWDQEKTRNANGHLIQVLEYNRGYLGKYPDGKTHWECSVWISLRSPDIERIVDYDEYKR